MAQSLSNILVHLIFSTKERQPLIGEGVADELYRYLATACATCGCPALRIGGTEDHVHILLSLSRTMAVSDLVEEVKKGASKWIKTKGPDYRLFTWQAGYGAFSIGQSQAEAVTRYIDGQREHHKKRAFQDEFRALLRRYQVEFDERYVWD
ncbi:MAG TPA: IS200/IS605 family transposase [Planctomycetota bacterium]|nr:IS200/IS605 family transposase [Planctomycetota bacterium]